MRSDARKRQAPESDGGPKIAEVLIHEVLIEDLRLWCKSRGLELQRCPFLDESPDLPVYNVAPSAERMRGVS